MIELDEKDVKAIASSRLSRKYKWWISGLLLSSPIGLIGVGLLSSIKSWPSFLVFIPGVFFLGLGIFYYIVTSKAEKALVKEWKKEN